MRPANPLTVFVKTKTKRCCLKAHFFLERTLMPGTCLARSAPLSTGHRLHRGRSRSVHAGKWCPYVLALLPPSILRRHPADRKHDHLCSPSTVGSSPSRLSALTPCFLLQSALKSLVDLKNFFHCQERFSATLALDVLSNAMS